MTWGPGVPATPTPHTNITVPFYVTNLQEPLNHLRNLLPDPLAIDRVLLSTAIGGTPTAAFAQVPTAALADGAVTAVKLATGVAIANLGYTPINPSAGGTMTAQLRIFRTQGASSGAFDAAPLVVQSPDAAANPAETAGIGLHRTNASGLYVFHGGLAAADLLRFITNTNVLATIFHSQNMGAGSGLDAATVLTHAPGAANGDLAILGTGGKVALAVAADTATSATSATSATTAATATNATNAANAAALNGLDWGIPFSATFDSFQSLTTSYADLSGVTVTLNRAGKWIILVSASFSMVSTDGIGSAQIVVNGVAQSPAAFFPSASLSGISGSTAVMVTAANGHVAKLQVKKASGTGGSTANTASLVAFWAGT